MENKKLANTQFTKDCKPPPLSAIQEITPKMTLFSIKNFKRAVDFQPKEKLPCKNTWYRDVKSTHIRNKRLLDLPFPKPKCCAKIYNISIDQQKLRKLEKFNLTRPVRSMTYDLEVETFEVCKPEPKQPVDKPDLPKPQTVIFPECYTLPDSDSDSDDENMVFEYCKSGSVSECSMCSVKKTSCGTRKKIHKLVKSDWRNLLHAGEVQLCKETINEEIGKHKLGMDFKLKLKKIF